jgi:hypothetical protein
MMKGEVAEVWSKKEMETPSRGRKGKRQQEDNTTSSMYSHTERR